MSEGVTNPRTSSSNGQGVPAASGDRLQVHFDAVAAHLFRAGLALDCLRHSAESPFVRTRADSAASALDQALTDLRALATAVSALEDQTAPQSQT